MIRASILLAALASSWVSTATAAQTATDCADAVDRVRRAARDADSAVMLDGERFEKGSLDNIRSALQDVEDRLEKAKRECGLSSRARIPTRPGIPIPEGSRRVNAWVQTMQASDPNFSRVEAQLGALLDQIALTIPPEHWVATLQLLYKAIGARP